MAINETIGLTASFTTAGGKVLSHRASNVTINDTSNFDVVINITRDWMTTAAASRYGSLYIKPTINIADEIIKRAGAINPSLRYLITIAADVAVVGDNEYVGAIHADSRIPLGTSITIENKGLLLGRGGRPAFTQERMVYFGVPLEKGYDGGPAITTMGVKLVVENTGGISGGGGGGGTTGANYQLAEGGYRQTEVGTSNSEFMTPGGGAPFGLRVSSSDGLEHLMYLNKGLLGELEGLSSPYQQTWGGINGVGSCKFIWVYVDYNNGGLVTGVYNSDRNRVTTLNAPIKLMPSMQEVYNRGSKTSVAGWGGTYYSAQIFDDIQHQYAFKLRCNPYGDPTPVNFTTKGAKVRAPSWAGLFKGGLGGEYEHGLNGMISASHIILLKEQALVDTYKTSFTGARGGDLGSNGSKGNTPQKLSAQFPLNGNNSPDKITIRNDLSYGKPPTECVATDGGSSGPLFVGDVTINSNNGGVVGGPSVIAKYDPNGNFDALARDTNYSKTFIPTHY